MIRQGKDFSGKLMGQDYNYNISDYVSIDSFYEYEKTFHNTDILPTVYASDYSKAKGIICSRSDCGYKENRQASPVYTPNPHPQSKQELECVSPDGGAEWWADNVLSDVGVCPSITFFLDSLMDYVREKNINLNIDVVRDKNGRELYHTLELGEYPQDHADNNNGIDSSRLEKLLKDKSTELTETGKSYIGDRNEDGTFDRFGEFSRFIF